MKEKFPMGGIKSREDLKRYLSEIKLSVPQPVRKKLVAPAPKVNIPPQLKPEPKFIESQRVMPQPAVINDDYYNKPKQAVNKPVSISPPPPNPIPCPPPSSNNKVDDIFKYIILLLVGAFVIIMALLYLIPESNKTKTNVSPPTSASETAVGSNYQAMSNSKSATSQERAREIMGKNFFGIEEAEKYFKIKPSDSDLNLLAEVPYSESTLKEYKNSHILVAVLPLSMLDIKNKVRYNILPDLDNGWCGRESSIKQQGVADWFLINKTEVQGSCGHVADEQLSFLSKKEDVPSVRVLVYAVVGYYLITGEFLFKKISVRTSSKMDDGGYFAITCEFNNGLVVGSMSENTIAYEGIGLASCIKKNF